MKNIANNTTVLHAWETLLKSFYGNNDTLKIALSLLHFEMSPNETPQLLHSNAKMNLSNLTLNIQTVRIVVRVEIGLSGISIRIPARTWNTPFGVLFSSILFY